MYIYKIICKKIKFILTVSLCYSSDWITNNIKIITFANKPESFIVLYITYLLSNLVYIMFCYYNKNMTVAYFILTDNP